MRKGPRSSSRAKRPSTLSSSTSNPEILGEARLGYEEVHNPEMFEPHFGIDESGKGDYFGPLVIAGVYTDADITRHLIDSGIQDSKRISSDKRIRELAAIVRESPGAIWETVTVLPENYNRMYKRFGNVNKLLAAGHAKVIELLARRRPDCHRSLSDQFAQKWQLESAVKRLGLQISVEQRTRAESDTAVAAASILAREAFVDWIDIQSKLLSLASTERSWPTGNRNRARAGRSNRRRRARKTRKTAFSNDRGNLVNRGILVAWQENILCILKGAG